MYKNIGKKIKGLALGTFIVEAVAAIIIGLLFIIEDEDMIPISLLIMVVGPVVAWIFSWVLYGFGELIDKTAKNECNTFNLLQLEEEWFRIDHISRLHAEGLISDQNYKDEVFNSRH